ncbi:MAG TPA: hypothetical protein VK081_09415 [Planctomycetota bacterium]|nr:hypothetical protein [Planctomycetota bacterium]
MRLLLPLVLAAVAPAQTTTNLFDIYSGCTNFTSRGVLNTNAGEYLQEIPATHFSGIGHDPTGAATSVPGFQYVTQDQDASTVETYSIVVRSDASGQPDASPAGLLLNVGPLNTPSGTGTLAWQVTVTLTTPTTAVPLCNTFYAGLQFSAANWTNDGQSLHVTDYPLGDNPAPGARTLTHNCLNGQAVSPPFFETLRMGLMVEASVLHMGNVDPTLQTTCLTGLGNRSFGAGGMWPQCTGPTGPRTDGLDCRVRDVRSANGVFALFLGGNVGCPGLPLGGLANGALYLNPAGPFVQVAAGTLDANGLGVATVVPPNVVPVTVVNRFLDFQAFSAGPTFTLPGQLSNRASVNYLP